MASTSPDNIFSPDEGQQWNLTSDWQQTAESVQAALNRRANSYSGTKLERLAFTPPENGVHWHDTDGDSFEYVWRNGRWHPIPRTYSGKVDLSPAGPDSVTSQTVNFPPGYFANPPAMQVTANTIVPGSTLVECSASSVTSSSALVNIYRTTTTNTTVWWTATEVPAD